MGNWAFSNSTGAGTFATTNAKLYVPVVTLSSAGAEAFAITDTKYYLPVVTLSTNNSANLLQNCFYG